ncbi:MAG: Xaa-Pro peptidase family protein [Candidatus Thorarchaeota archaeon]|nr:Xaa-Pro peptidase family protein [Candidatus Thorarchaeota archaeon]
MLDESIYRSRIIQIQKQLNDSDTDFMLLTPEANFQYLTGYPHQMRERLVALLLRKGAEPELIVPAFEESNHSSQTWIKEIIPWEEDESPYGIIAELVGKRDDGPTALLDESLPLGIYWLLEKAFGKFKKVLSITPTMKSLRIIKSEHEVALLRKAGHIIDDAVMKAFRASQIGMTELQVRQIVQEEVIRQGATPSFAAIQFGKNSAFPHADSSNRELRKGDVILMDCGCSLDGYNTDMTRVGVLGEPSEDIELVYSIVRKAQETAIEKISRGVVCGNADGIARRVIEEAGYGDYFTHRLGHGIGLEVHEPPYLVRGNAEELGVGMCHSIEPGVYLEGQFGIRIEDLVYIREDGPEVITYSPKDLILLNP